MLERGHRALGPHARLALGAAGVLAVAALIGPAAAESATAQTQTYSTPGAYTFTVPDNVISITVHAVGAAGGSCSPFLSGIDPDAGLGGKGASVTATVAVTPGSTLPVGVGGTGGACVPGLQIGARPLAVANATGGGGAGGVNGGAAGGAPPTFGGASGAGGGGASGVLASATSPLVVAGGGGGASYCQANGGNADSAGTSGQTANTCEGTNAAGQGGGAGTLTAGGAGGAAGGTSSSAGAAGSTENGGAGGDGATDFGYSGGGGGGGLHGGGGGGGGEAFYGGGGGGGGASFVLPSATSVTAPAATTAAAEVTITYTAVPPPKATTHKASGVKQTSCTLHGTVNGQGLATTSWFDWGKSKSYGHTTSKHHGSGASRSVSAVIKHLSSGKTYHFRVVAQTASGTTVGKDMKCTTTKPKPKVKPVFTG